MILIISSFDSYHLPDRNTGIISLLNVLDMQTIITPVDFSDISINAVNYAADMAMNLNAKLLVLHAIGLPVNVNKIFYESSTAEIEAEQKLNNLKENFHVLY